MVIYYLFLSMKIWFKVKYEQCTSVPVIFFWSISIDESDLVVCADDKIKYILHTEVLF